jgi:hypothetical protein
MLRLQIKTKAGYVELGKQLCYISEEEDEFLLSKNALEKVGINIDHLIEQAAKRQKKEGKNIYESDEDDDLIINNEPQGESEQALQTLVKEAIDKGFPIEMKHELERIIRKYDVWRTCFKGSDPPADVPPMDIKLKEGSQPYRCKARKINPLEARFLEVFGEQLIRDGVVRPNNASSYCSPVNPVMKASGKKMNKPSSEWTDEEL